MSSVTDMSRMFTNTDFNQDIGNWDVSSVTDMTRMFSFASTFNQDIGNWDVSSVTNMIEMFADWEGNRNNPMSFDQDIGNWDVSSVSFMNGMFRGVTLATKNYDSLLNGWSRQLLRSKVTFDGGNSKYSSA